MELTDIELKVLTLVCREKSVAEMSQAVGLARRGVEKIKTSLYKKTGTTSSLSLFKWAVKNGKFKWKF